MENLTKREKEIMGLLLDGKSTKEIAFDLKITLPTVDFHKNNLYRKLNINSMQELFAKNLAEEPPIKIVSAENPMIITFANDGQYGWQYNYHSQKPFYDKKIKINDKYIFNCTFMSNVKINLLMVALVDNAVQEDNFWTELTDFLVLRRDIFPNIEYKNTIEIIPTKSASTTKFTSNVLRLQVHFETKEQPILNFTQFEIIKV